MAEQVPTDPSMTGQDAAERPRAPELRWQSSARWTLVAVVGVTLLGALGFYVLFLRGESTPPPPARPVTTTSSAPTTVVTTTVVDTVTVP